ncbi:hypothetical protein NEP96_06590 [Escherichia coli]|uniref:hypothetical protein n=1 Tax=Escherichia coli TaxID=562 RepID=UPI002489A1AF|nr:hypothetical protein [Escherichia coli]
MITFKKTANHIHEIYINGHKAGLLRLLAHHPNATVSDNEPKDWRVFFFGKYSDFQVSNLKNIRSVCTLTEIKEKLAQALKTNPDGVLPPDNFVEKGYALAHFKDGTIQSISTEYEYQWTEYFTYGSRNTLMASRSKLEEVLTRMNERERQFYDKPEMWSSTYIDRIDYVIMTPIFDTAYYDSLK